MDDSTKQERNAISKLKQAAKIWPDSLWLFSANGKLHVMRKDENGERFLYKDGGMHRDASIDTINIENDGGDW